MHRLAEKSLYGAVNVPRAHRLAPTREHTDDRVQDPVVSTMPRADWKTRLLGVAPAPDGVHAPVRAAFQQGFQGSRKVGMVSG
jgi:hypothetical protein